MEKKRKIFLSALNIAMHSPHSPDRYLSLLWRVAEERRVVNLGKVYGAVLGSLERVDGLSLLSGELYKFIRVDPSEPWFNAVTKKAASGADVEKIHIPPNLFPHLQIVPFVFNPENHSFHFLARDRNTSVSPMVVAKIMQNLINPLIQSGFFPHVEITVIPENDSLDKILGMHKLNTLIINLVRPNPDGSDDIKSNFLRKLESERARRRIETLNAMPGESLRPDQDTKIMAEVASENGFVRGVGTGVDGVSIDESTKNSPKMKCVTLDPKIENERYILVRESLA